jgi:CHAT domain-containing protein
LIGPARAIVGRAERVLICPDGPLQILPFAALVSGAAPLRYFIQDKPLHTTFSMTAYAETRGNPATAASAARGAATLLAFGDPVYAKPSAPRPAPATNAPTGDEADFLQRRTLSLTPLPGTRREVQQIVSLFGRTASARLGQAATEAAARRDTRDVQILHFASHGWIDDEMGLSSGLALSQPEALGRAPTAEDNGWLQAWEIFESVRLQADLVVLSACRTGLGQDLRGEGLIGLTRAFLYAGARSVVVSLWDISDAGAADYMTAFYRELRRGGSKDAALQRAAAAVSRDPARRHPFYWAAFTLTGSWQ